MQEPPTVHSPLPEDDWDEVIGVTSAPPAEFVEVTTSAPVAGGAALAREADGRVLFVEGALPGERVRAVVTERKRDFGRARLIDVLDASADRIVPPCPYVAAGCGGCDLQHADPAAQPELKRRIVVDALRRLGRMGRDAEPIVELAPPLSPFGFRTTVRAAVLDGRAGYRRAREHDVVAVEHCLIAHPLIDEVLHLGRFDGCTEITVRAGVATGERLIVADPATDDIELPEDMDALVVSANDLRQGTRAWIHEDVGGRRFRISALSFFQTRPDGAAALVDTVRVLGGDELASASTVIDAYAGVGLFGALTTPDDARVVAVESGTSSVVDARHNLAHRQAKVIRSSVERWRPTSADVVIADPARTGLGKAAADVLARTHASVIVLVSCDAAALGRDTALLAARGYRHERSVLVGLLAEIERLQGIAAGVWTAEQLADIDRRAGERRRRLQGLID